MTGGSGSSRSESERSDSEVESLCPILTRLPAPLTLPRHQSEIINYGLWPQKEGYSPHTMNSPHTINDVKRLRRLDYASQ